MQSLAVFLFLLIFLFDISTFFALNSLIYQIPMFVCWISFDAYVWCGCVGEGSSSVCPGGICVQWHGADWPRQQHWTRGGHDPPAMCLWWKSSGQEGEPWHALDISTFSLPLGRFLVFHCTTSVYFCSLLRKLSLAVSILKLEWSSGLECGLGTNGVWVRQ